VPPTDIDVILVAPKGSGRTVRSLFKEGRGINSSFAVFQDVTGKAEEKAVALGVAIGSGYLYKTTFEKEVYSDLYGERGCLMGGIQGMFLAQYEVLRERGHSPSEAFNETVEEATQSLYPLIGANGMDWMYEACSTTARRGALDWAPKFKDALKVFTSVECANSSLSSTICTTLSRMEVRLRGLWNSVDARITEKRSRRNSMRSVPRKSGAQERPSEVFDLKPSKWPTSLSKGICKSQSFCMQALL
jgi:ketol-acid reductoisomerase